MRAAGTNMATKESMAARSSHVVSGSSAWLMSVHKKDAGFDQRTFCGLEMGCRWDYVWGDTGSLPKVILSHGVFKILPQPPSKMT